MDVFCKVWANGGDGLPLDIPLDSRPAVIRVSDARRRPLPVHLLWRHRRRGRRYVKPAKPSHCVEVLVKP